MFVRRIFTDAAIAATLSLTTTLLLTLTASQDSSNSEFRSNFGMLIGKLNVYHHGVSGSVYAVNETTLLIKNFNYDGQGKDAYFWGGSGGTGPGPNGFIIPDQYGR
jgi:hypothetical protein